MPTTLVGLPYNLLAINLLLYIPCVALYAAAYIFKQSLQIPHHEFAQYVDLTLKQNSSECDDLVL